MKTVFLLLQVFCVVFLMEAAKYLSKWRVELSNIKKNGF